LPPKQLNVYKRSGRIPLPRRKREKRRGREGEMEGEIYRYIERFFS
jgi:hypothetical protein